MLSYLSLVSFKFTYNKNNSFLLQAVCSKLSNGYTSLTKVRSFTCYLQLKTPISNFNGSNYVLGNNIDALENLLESALRYVVESDTVVPRELSTAVINLHNSVYTWLQYIPWIHKNPRTAYVQLVTGEQLTLRMHPVLQHKMFLNLCEKISFAYQDMENDNLALALKSLIYLGVDTSSLFMHNLLYEWRNRLPQNCINTLRISSLVYKNSNHYDVISGRLIANRLAYLVNNWDEKWTSANGVALCSCVLNLHILSSELACKIGHKLLEIVHSTEFLATPRHIGLCIKLGQVLMNYFPSSDCRDIAKELILKASAALSNFSIVDIDDLVMISKELRVCGFYTDEMGEQIELFYFQNNDRTRKCNAHL